MTSYFYISQHHDNPLAGHFGIEKTRELIARKCDWETIRHDVKDYMKGCNICLALKAVRHKPYNDFQLLPEPTRVAYIYGLEKQQL